MYDTKMFEDVITDEDPFAAPEETAMNVFAMKAGGDLTYAYFTITCDRVEVVALVGYTKYYDQVMSVREARDVWKSLENDYGFARVDASRALEAMPIERLRLFIYD
jgi:hypothetical protein